MNYVKKNTEKTQRLRYSQIAQLYNQPCRMVGEQKRDATFAPENLIKISETSA